MVMVIRLNNKGFTTIELLIVVFVFSIVYFVSVLNVTYAFETDNTEVSYDQKITLIEKQAEIYASDTDGFFAEEDTIYLYVKDLIEYGYLKADEDGNVVNPLTPNKFLNDDKIKIEKIGEKIVATFVKI